MANDPPQPPPQNSSSRNETMGMQRMNPPPPTPSYPTCEGPRSAAKRRRGAIEPSLSTPTIRARPRSGPQVDRRTDPRRRASVPAEWPAPSRGCSSTAAPSIATIRSRSMANRSLTTSCRDPSDLVWYAPDAVTSVPMSGRIGPSTRTLGALVARTASLYIFRHIAHARRLLGCDRGWRLGTDGHFDAYWIRSCPAESHRFSQCGGILHHRGGGDDILH